MAIDTNGAFGFEDTVDVPETGFTILPDGECFFTVTKIDRQKKAFGKFGTIHVAVVTMLCTPVEGDGEITMDVQLPLVTQMGWKTVQLATACGLRKHGESSTVNTKWWTAFVGTSGRCVMGHRIYKGKTGEDRTSNDITSFIDPSTEPEAPNFD